MLTYSVALCTYNGSKYVIEQLESIVNQTIPPSQIVVSDDGSKDETMKLVDNYLSNKSIEYILVSNYGKHGVTANFQNAMNLCKSPIIFMSDQDDIWLKDKAEKMLAVYEQHSNACLVFSDGELVNNNLTMMNCSVWKAVGITDQRIEEGDWFHYLLKNCLITGAGMSVRKELLDDIDEIPQEWLHDGWLAWAAVFKNGLYPCNNKLFYYRQHENNVVGMAPSYALRNKMKDWAHNFGEMKAQREIRYKRYKSLKEKWGYRFTSQQQQELNECVSFWERMYAMSSRNRIQNVITVFDCYFKGYYHRFFVGNRGFIRDFFLTFTR